jgi:hypothetical protein
MLIRGMIRNQIYNDFHGKRKPPRMGAIVLNGIKQQSFIPDFRTPIGATAGSGFFKKSGRRGTKIMLGNLCLSPQWAVEEIP